MRISIVSLALMAMPLVPAQAGFVTNGSFESGIAPGSFTSIGSGDTTSITGWTVGGGGVDYVGSLWAAGDGMRSVDLSRVTAGSISQTVQGLTAGTTYDVSFFLAGNSDRSLGDNTIPIKHLLVSASGQSQAYTFDITGHTTTSMGWTRMDFIFVAGGTTATLAFASQDNNPYGPALDKVDLVALPTTVPEPASAISVGLGTLGMLGMLTGCHRWTRRHGGVEPSPPGTIDRRAAARALISLAGLQFCRSVYALDDRRSAIEKSLRRARENFDGKIKKIRDSTLIGYDRRIKDVEGERGLLEGAKKDRKEQLAEAKDAFDRYRTFPPGDEYNNMALEFASSMDLLFSQGNKAIAGPVAEASRKGFPDLVRLGQQIKEHLGEEIARVGKFSPDTQYHGTMNQPGGRSIPYRIHFSQVGTGGLFKGHVEDNFGVAGNWSYDMAGQANGLAFEYRWTRTTRGLFTDVYASGLVCGDRLFGVARQVVGQNQGTFEKFILRRI